jgi:hypothetical protein
VLNLRVGPFLDDLFDCEARRLEEAPQRFGTEVEIHSYRVSAPLIRVQDILNDVKGQKQQISGSQGALDLTERLADLGTVKVNSRVKCGHAGSCSVTDARGEHVALPERDHRIQSPGMMHHHGRQVNSTRLHAPFIKVSENRLRRV